MRVTRRDVLAVLAEVGALAASSAWPLRAFSQGAPPAAAATAQKLIVRSTRPPDFETPVALLDAWLTPNEHFYVRSHLPAPTGLDGAAWRLKLDGEVAAPAALSLEEIRRLPAVTIAATLECAGNGRAFYDPPVAGVQWTKGAVGTARWTGV